jgi:Na+-driven multidrug efflux pump
VQRNTLLQSTKYAHPEDRREVGLSLITIGCMLWCFDLLVAFFLPAGYRIGHQRAFLLLIGSAAVAGIILVLIGWKMKAEQ